MADSHGRAYRVLTLNNISVRGLERFPRGRFEVSEDIGHPHAILLRSTDMHAYEVPDTVLAVARAGAGTNNIPVSLLTGRGIPVFNAPGANANAVKELVLAGLLMAARNLEAAMQFVRGLAADDPDLDATVERAKKRFTGFELPGKTLGVVGLGAIGVEVANMAHALGMRVLGYDPAITVQRAWQLSASVEQAQGLDDLFGRCDAVSVHVPLLDATRGLVNASRVAMLRPGAVLLNFSRAPIVDEQAVLEALGTGILRTYVCDFPSAALLDNPGVIAFPHLGASTAEAEENCAVMAADTLRDFLEHGSIRHSVNFPEASLPRITGTFRLALANSNVPNMVGQISTALAEAGLNIADLLNKSRGGIAYTLIDTDAPIPPEVLASIASIPGVLSARLV